MSVKLKLTFKDKTGEIFTLSYGYVRPDVSIAEIRALTEKLLENGEIFLQVPDKLIDARLLESKEIEIEEGEM